MVDGGWFNYFHKVVTPLFDDEACVRYEKLLDSMYGDFFERNLSREKGKLLALGAGFGMTEIPLARRGYKVIGIDNDQKVLELLVENAKNYARGNLEPSFGDLYSDFHKDYINKDIQACISFGVLEHFKVEDLEEIVKKQFLISPLMICMMPIATPPTLKTFKAEEKPEANIDQFGIYRNFWPVEFWEHSILKKYDVVDRHFSTNHSSIGQIDMVTFAVRKD